MGVDTVDTVDTVAVVDTVGAVCDDDVCVAGKSRGKTEKLKALYSLLYKYQYRLPYICSIKMIQRFFTVYEYNT